MVVLEVIRDRSKCGGYYSSEAHVDALRHDLDPRDRVGVVARRRRDRVVKKVPDLSHAAERLEYNPVHRSLRHYV